MDNYIHTFLATPVKAESLISAFQTAGIGVWDLTLGAHSQVIWDNRCRELFGLSKENKISYEEAIKYIHPDDAQRVQAAVTKALDPASGGIYNIRYRTIGADDGVLRMVHFVGKAAFNEAGVPQSFSGIALDMSHEMTLLEERQKIRVLIDNNPDFMGISNNDNIIIELNKAAFALLGIDADIDIGTLKSADFYPAEQKELMLEIYETMQRKESWKGNVFLKHFKTGEYIPGFGSYETVINPETGRVIGKSVTVRDRRPELLAQKTLQDNEALFRNVTQNAPTGLWMSDTEGGLIYLNKTLVDWTGMSYQALLGAGWANAIVDEDRQRSMDAFLAAIKNNTHYDVEFRIHKSDGTICWCRAAGDPYTDAHGNYAGYAGFCMDIHQRVEMANAIQQSEERTRSIVNQAPVAIGVLRGKEFVVESGNETILKIWGKDTSIIGLPLIEALPEIKGQGFVKLLNQVYNTGIAFNGNGVLARLEHNGELQDLYFDFVYAPLRDADQIINGILVIASDVTAQVLAKKVIEQSEAKFRSLIEEAPVPTAVLMGRELVIDIANEAMIKIWGKGASIVGMPLATALPELNGQPFLKILDDIFITGKSFEADEAKAELIIDGELKIIYFNFAYKPLFDANGNVYAIIDMAIDVTEQVLNKKKIIEAEAQLRSAIETAELGTWEVHLLTGKFEASARMKYWFGFEDKDTMTFQDILDGIPDNEALKLAVKKAKEDHLNSIVDVEYTIVNKITNRSYFMHTQGQVFYNEQHVPHSIIGTTRDISIQKNTELELEMLVQERTEELQSMNEEMAATNEELEESNENLYRSNEELSQYAYVASHDLQEPLRKIRVFAGILSKNKSLSEENRPLVDKINQSSQRMSLLIKDLLEFSRLSKSNELAQEVDLNLILQNILSDFELRISETSAIISIDPLPVIKAVPLQMNQLFYNLLSNALKFIDPDRIPQIKIVSKPLTYDEVALHIRKPILSNTYYQIFIQDNGIGFEEKYADQIFEVFKRLHGKDIYPGSGIGLALCRRIVNNHGGALYSKSEPGYGTTFYLILPVV
jgi:PAS domain S-box-containing protein